MNFLRGIQFIPIWNESQRETGIDVQSIETAETPACCLASRIANWQAAEPNTMANLHFVCFPRLRIIKGHFLDLPRESTNRQGLFAPLALAVRREQPKLSPASSSSRSDLGEHSRFTAIQSPEYLAPASIFGFGTSTRTQRKDGVLTIWSVVRTEGGSNRPMQFLRSDRRKGAV
jgi:hypothetical protein